MSLSALFLVVRAAASGGTESGGQYYPTDVAMDRLGREAEMIVGNERADQLQEPQRRRKRRGVGGIGERHGCRRPKDGPRQQALGRAEPPSAGRWRKRRGCMGGCRV